MKKIVGLIVLSKDLNEVFFAVLQKRGKHNSETGKPETFPGCLQVSCHGGLENNEDFLDALTRESMQELGEKFTRQCRAGSTLSLVTDEENEKRHVKTFATFVQGHVVDMIVPGKDVGEIIRIMENDIKKIVPMTPDMKEAGAPDGVMAMFPDEIEALKKAFQAIRPGKPAE